MAGAARATLPRHRRPYLACSRDDGGGADDGASVDDDGGADDGASWASRRSWHRPFPSLLSTDRYDEVGETPLGETPRAIPRNSAQENDRREIGIVPHFC